MGDENEHRETEAESESLGSQTVELGGGMAPVLDGVHPLLGAGAELGHGALSTRNGGRQLLGRPGNRVAGAFTAAGGLATIGHGLAEGGHWLAQARNATHAAHRLHAVSERLSTAGGVVSTVGGAWNMYQGMRNWHHDPNRAEGQLSTGATGMLSGGATLAAPVMQASTSTLGAGLIEGSTGLIPAVGEALPALGVGLAAGTFARNVANGDLRETGALGQTGVTTRRGFRPDEEPAPTQNRDVDDVNADVGVDIQRRTGSVALGALGAMAVSPFTTAFGVAHRMGLATANSGTGDIEAADAEERGAPAPARSDQSALAERRRQIRRARARRAEATAATHAQLQQQIAADGHRDTTMNTTGRFVPINAGGQSIERAALGMAPTLSDDDLARMIASTP
jgi:hypothetical protein